MITGKATADIKFEQYTALLVIKSIQIDILKYAHIKIMESYPQQKKIMESELWVTVVYWHGLIERIYGQAQCSYIIQRREFLQRKDNDCGGSSTPVWSKTNWRVQGLSFKSTVLTFGRNYL